MNIRTNITPRRPGRRDANRAQAGSINWDQGRVTMRLSSTTDDRQLRQLAMLDSSKPLRQPILLAELDGTITAALSLSTGTGIADPFQRTLGLIELLRVRACQLALGADAHT